MRRLLPPAPRRRIGFMLTPLIDVIFLLLIFFMLSSQIAPFGLLPVSETAGRGAGETAPRPAPDTKSVTLRITRGHISAGDRTITLTDLPTAIRQMQEAGITGVLLLSARSATVQDVVSTLEAFKTAEFPNVALLGRAGEG